MVRDESNTIMVIVSGFFENCSAAGALAQHFGRIVVDRNSCLGVQPQQEKRNPGPNIGTGEPVAVRVC
jgi:hypothetical protein